jgi:hypothetical protein
MGYNLASKEAINLFLKGFSNNRNLLDKVFTPPVPTAYGAIKRHLITIIKSMQLVNSIAQNTSDFLSLLGHGVASIPIRVLYSHAGLDGTTEDLLSQTTKLKYHVIGQVIQITCKVM